MYKNGTKTISSVGASSACIPLLTGKFPEQPALINFIDRLFIGLSIVLNLYSIIVLTKKTEKS